MKTITVPRELKFSDNTPGMTTLEEELFVICALQKLTIEKLTPWATEEGFEDDDYLTDVLFETNKALDTYTETVRKLRLEETE